MKQLSAGKRRKLTNKLSKFFKCSDRHHSIRHRFNLLYHSTILTHRFDCIDPHDTIDSLLNNPKVARTSKAVSYDESTATMTIHAGRRRFKYTSGQVKRMRRAIRKFNQTARVVPSVLARSIYKL